MVIIWALIIIILGFLELNTMKFKSVWFAFSGFISLIISFANKDFLMQFIIFIVLGQVLSLLLRSRVLKKIVVSKNLKKSI